MARKMRDSGVEWIGEVPEGWEVNRLQWHLEELVEKNDPIQTTNILSLTNDRGVIPYEDKGNVGNKAKENYTEYKLAYKNTIVANSMNVLIGSVGLSKYDGCVSPVYYIYKSRDSNSIRYYNYLFQLTPFQKELRRYANGILEIRLRVSSSDILKRSVPAPSFSEQRRIADYLDEKCAAIDGAVDELKRGIEDCKAWKKSFIFEAVTGKKRVNCIAAKNTKGAKISHNPVNLVNPIKTKPSGIPWLGDVPEEWEMKRLRYLATSFRKGAGITKADVIENGGIACIRYGEIYSRYKNYVAVEKCLSRTNENLISCPQRIYKGDILFSCTGELVEEIGKNIAYLGDEECLAGGDIIVVGHNQDPVFLSYALNSYAQTQKSHDKTKLKVVHISTGDIKNLLVAIPPLAEQRTIADYLDRKCAAIDALVAEKEKLIADLEAYKKSLIFELVTGKREVA